MTKATDRLSVEERTRKATNRIVSLLLVAGFLCTLLPTLAMSMQANALFYRRDTYYYDKLSSNGKRAYSTLVKQIPNLKKEIAIPDVDSSERKLLLNAVMYEHPELFYFNRKFTYKTRGGQLYVQPNYSRNAKTMIRQCDTAVNNFLKGAPTRGSDYEKVLYVHDKLCKEVKYQKNNGNCANMYGALVQHKAVCDGYTYASLYLLSKLGVTARYVYGTAGKSARRGENHSWTVVKVSGQEYVCDTTWDANMSSDVSFYSHRYFLRTKYDFKRDHFPKEESMWSRCTYGVKDYYTRNGLYFSSQNDLDRRLPTVLAKFMKKKDYLIGMEFGSTLSTRRAVRHLIDEGEIYTAIKEARKIAGITDKDYDVIYIKNTKMNVVDVILKEKAVTTTRTSRIEQLLPSSYFTSLDIGTEEDSSADSTLTKKEEYQGEAQAAQEYVYPEEVSLA
ncbi:MAG: hypothetical protein IJ133_03850 [Clostridia bacterium]|nr:hypothetical protein [Clostridia bacterium]